MFFLIHFLIIFEFLKIEKISAFPNLPRNAAGNANLTQNLINILPKNNAQHKAQKHFKIENNMKNKYCNITTKGRLFNSMDLQKLVNNYYLSAKSKNQKIIAQSMENNQRQNLSYKTHFDYANQLKIMLANKMEIERVRMATIGALGGEFQRMKIDAYPIYALNEAFSKANELAEHSAETETAGDEQQQQQNEVERILEIAGAMWKAIKKLNKLQKKEEKNAVEALVHQQLRFVGLVLWHLAVRQSPIPFNDGQLLVFIAKMRPNIDVHDPDWQTMLRAFDQNLSDITMPESRKIGQNYGKVSDEEEENESHYQTQIEMLRELEEKMGQGQAEFGDQERHAELGKQFTLLQTLSRNGTEEHHAKVPMSHFCIAFRPFFVFGSQTFDILLFIRALLGGNFDEKTMDEYLENGKRIEINSYLLTTVTSLRMMATQLLTLEEIFENYF